MYLNMIWNNYHVNLKITKLRNATFITSTNERTVLGQNIAETI